jgi:C1A family cysteine protease
MTLPGPWTTTLRNSADVEPLRTFGVAGAIALVAAALVPAAWAQLSSEDIAALRERGRAEGWTFTVGENQATRYPLESLCGLVEPADWRDKGRFDSRSSRGNLPESYDWRDYGGCTPIRSQGPCGSCWAFAAMGAMECNILIRDGLNLDLSEQWLVSCTVAGSCSGGWHGVACEHLRCGGLKDP